MARSYANIITAIWTDPDFRALPSGAQRDYLMLVTQPNISAAGTLPLTIRRWAALAPDTTAESIHHNLKVLAAASFVVVDHDTEELLVRSFVRHDNGYGNPKRRPAIRDAATETTSSALRRVLAAELARLGLPAWLGDMPDDTPPLPPDSHSIANSGVPCGPTTDIGGNREPHDETTEPDTAPVDNEFPQVNSLSIGYETSTDSQSDWNRVVVTKGPYVRTPTLNPQTASQAQTEGQPDETGPGRGPVQDVDRLPSPRDGAQPPPNHVPDEPPGRIRFALEVHRVIADGLAHIPDLTEAEVRAIHSALVAGRFGKAPGLPLLRIYAKDGDKLPAVLAEVRAAAKQARADKIARLRKQGTECPHRTPGGAEPHPTTGQPLCPECRAGIPAPTNPGPDPLAEYVRAYLATHREEIPWATRREVIHQINHMRDKHAPEADILALAIAAARAKTDLHTHARSLADAS